MYLYKHVDRDIRNLSFQIHNLFLTRHHSIKYPSVMCIQKEQDEGEKYLLAGV